MATVILTLIFVLFVIAATPWVDFRSHFHGMHHTDLMSGDEGED